MKKWSLFLIVCVLAVLGACGSACAPGAGAAPASASASASETQAPGKQVATPVLIEEDIQEVAFAEESEIIHCLEGEVEYLTMNVLELNVASGACYYFSIEGAQLDTGPSGLMLGETVRLYYSGTLNTQEASQQVFVVRVESENYVPRDVETEEAITSNAEAWQREWALPGGYDIATE